MGAVSCERLQVLDGFRPLVHDGTVGNILLVRAQHLVPTSVGQQLGELGGVGRVGDL